MSKSVLSRVAGVLDASNFAFGINPAIPPARVVNSPGASGSQTLQLYFPNIVLGDGSSFNPFSTTAPLTFDVGANAETVTPTAVSTVTGGPAGLAVNITATFSNVHGQGCLVTSGTAGLQEAINHAGTVGGGVVVIDGAWVGYGGTAAILNAAAAVSGVSVVDNRGAIPVPYSGTTDAITFPQRVNIAEINTAGVDAATLATPAATDAGKLLIISSSTANAHTVTTAANKIQDGSGTNGDTLTFGAHAGANCVLLAISGFWQVVALKNVTLSEV